MVLQLSPARRNSCITTLTSGLGSGTLRIRTGLPPANTAAPRLGTILATVTLPVTPFAAASGGAAAISGTWEDLSADNSGTAGHFEIEVSAVIEMQGTVTATGGGGDMTVNSVTFTATQPFTVTGGSITMGGA